MQFSLRTLLMAAIVVAIVVGGFLNAKRERDYERLLLGRVNHYPSLGLFEIEREYTDQHLIELFEKYSPRAKESDAGKIAAHAMYNLVKRGNPFGVQNARRYLESDVSPLWETAVYALLQQYELPIRVDGEFAEDMIDSGIESDTPLGQFVLASNVHWIFVERNEWSTMSDDWHSAEMRTAYEDSIAALRAVFPTAAEPYAEIVSILRTHDGFPQSQNVRDRLSNLSSEVSDQLVSPAAVLRHLIRHAKLREEMLRERAAT